MPREGYSSVTLPSKLVRKARRLLESPLGERYQSLSELASEALQEKLESLSGVPIVATGATSREDAERMILAYLRQKPGVHYPSDIAYALGLDLDVVFEVTNSLLREHVIETKSPAQKEIEAQ
jgi:Arc/MetJ-type ribon-helix-helix transcriptional regulator